MSVSAGFRTANTPDEEGGCTAGEHGVLDCGMKGKGITREQSSELFAPVERLQSHSQIEGSGLGLLSVKRIVEAHGGEAFIEGYADGTPESQPFTTAMGSYPRMLGDRFLTAFVITCPAAVAT